MHDICCASRFNTLRIRRCPRYYCKPKNQILKAYTSSIINGKKLIAQGGTFDAEVSGSSQIFAIGTVTNPALKAYSASIINGKELIAQGDSLYTKASESSTI